MQRVIQEKICVQDDVFNLWSYAIPFETMFNITIRNRASWVQTNFLKKSWSWQDRIREGKAIESEGQNQIEKIDK